MFGVVNQVRYVLAVRKANKWVLASAALLAALLALQLIAPAHAGVAVPGGH